MKKVISLLFCLSFIYGCISNKKSQAIDTTLDEISACIDTNYTKAGKLISELKQDSANMSASQKMYFMLLNINYSDKKDRITTPVEEVQQLVAYYEKHERHSEKRFRANYYLAGTYRDMGDYPMAVTCYKKTIDIFGKGEVKCRDIYVARCYSQLSQVLNTSFLANEALKYDLKSLKYIHKPEMYASACFNVATDYSNLKKYKEAAYYHNKAYSVKGLSSIEKADIGQSQVSFFINRNDTANILKRVADLDVITKLSPSDEYLLYENRAKYFEFINQKDSAILNWKKTFAQREYLDQQKASGHLYQLYKQKGNTAEAFKYADLYMAYTDTMQHKIESESVARATQLYDYTAYQQKSQQAELEKQKRTTLLVGIILAIVILATWAIALLAYKKKQRQIALAEVTHKNEQLLGRLNAEKKNTEILSQTIEDNDAILKRLKEKLANQKEHREQLETEIAEKVALLDTLNQRMQVHLDAEDDMQIKLNESNKKIRTLEEQLKIERAFRDKLSDALEDIKNRMMNYEGEMPTAMWKEYADAFNAKYPNMKPYIMQHLPECQLQDLQIIYLYCEGFSGKRMSMLLNVTMQYLNSRKKRIYCKMTGVDRATAEETLQYFNWLKSIGGTIIA